MTKFHSVVAATLLLAACAQQPPRDISTPRPAREAIVGYTIEGRIAVKRGNESRQAAIGWLHGADRDDIELTGPLGQKAARLTRDRNGATLQTSSRETITAPDWGGLAERVLDVALPLDNIAHWVTGSFSSGDAIERDGVGRPKTATANGWKIAYLTYESPAPDALPTLIQMRRDDIEVRLKIDQWQID